MVVPDGTLFGSGVAGRIKAELLREFNLHTIVRLPNGVFAPYTGISTNLLFFDRSGPTDHIWYYEVPLPAGRNNYTKTQPMQFDEFRPCLEWWNNRKENSQAWMVSAKDIIKHDGQGELISVNLDIKNPSLQKQPENLPPDKLVDALLGAESRICETLTNTRRLLAENGGAFSDSLDLRRYLCRIDDSPIVLNGETRNPQVAYGDKEFSYIDISSVERGPNVIRQGKVIRGIDAPSRARRVVRKGDIIASTVRINLRAIALVGDELDDQICSTGFAVFSCPEGVDPEFMLYQFCSPFFIDQCIAKSTGGHYPAINDTSLREVNIVLPPIGIQKQIVRRLRGLYEKIDLDIQLVEKLREQTSRDLARLPLSVLSEAFGHGGAEGAG